MNECVMLSAPPSITVRVCMVYTWRSFTFERHMSAGLFVRCSYVQEERESERSVKYLYICGLDLVTKQSVPVARENQEKVLSCQKGTRQWKRMHKTQRRLKLHQTQQASVPIHLAIHCTSTLYYVYIV